jgi:hypothetical protein
MLSPCGTLALVKKLWLGLFSIALASSACNEPECSYSGSATVFELDVNFLSGTPQETIDEVLECIEARVIETFPPALVRVEINGREELCDALDTLDGEDSVDNVVTSF